MFPNFYYFASLSDQDTEKTSCVNTGITTNLCHKHLIVYTTKTWRQHIYIYLFGENLRDSEE